MIRLSPTEGIFLVVFVEGGAGAMNLYFNHPTVAMGLLLVIVGFAAYMGLIEGD